MLLSPTISYSQLIEYFNVYLFSFLFVIFRIGGFFISMPYASYINTRVKTIFLISIAYIIAPLIDISISESSYANIVIAVIIEFLIGILIGKLAFFIFSSLSVVGEVISSQTNLSSLVVHDSIFEEKNSIFTKFFTFTCLIMLFIYDVHLYLIKLIVESYVVIPILNFSTFSDLLQFFLKYFSDVLVIALKVASPVLTLCLLINFIIGFINRLIPNVQFFFIAVPIQMMMLFILIVFGLDTMLSYLVDNIHFVFERLF